MKPRLFEKILSGILICFGIGILGIALSSIKTNDAQALDNQTYETDWTPMSYALSTTSVNGSTSSVTGILTDYTIYISTSNSTSPIGGAYTISFTTGTNRNGTFAVVTSSTILVPANVLWVQKSWVGAYNPKIILGGLSTAATAQVEINYGQYRTGQ